MELLKPNYVDTTTAFTVQSNTATAAYLFDRDTSFQYVSSGYNDDLTTTVIRVNFSETMTVDRIALLGHNLKDYNFYYNGVTANQFVLSGGATTASSFTGNSETSQYFRATPVDCTSVTFELRKTMTANSEKAIGYLVVSQIRLDFERDPSSKGYVPKADPMDVVHHMSDGGTRIQTVDEKWAVDIKLEHITTSFRNSLRTIYKLHDSHIFVPFGTTTAWDELIFPCVWDGPFEFYRYADDSPGAGFNGQIKLRETAR